MNRGRRKGQKRGRACHKKKGSDTHRRLVTLLQRGARVPQRDLLPRAQARVRLQQAQHEEQPAEDPQARPQEALHEDREEMVGAARDDRGPEAVKACAVGRWLLLLLLLVLL